MFECLHGTHILTCSCTPFVGPVLYQLESRSLSEIKSMTLPAWEKIVINANKAGARTCEYMGAMEAFKHLSSDIFK